ncbi:potassium-transporting ATPase subunit KdpA [Lachnoclostridium pacaense]|uniref:potassium-transporting ATPase subunit KdpA n=1 Tax=Enterocloster hominis (ex Hitch et al. 2024) TaxID=1917870 RepID=UPI001D114710|nr:potassium-transporting ATPase subunit KdpA [Lachnoclostridium pacaense]MCC2879268.1 potassium-transporting ATPase subunit KdpA [Lachnoclostridium pacaense]
MMNVTVQMVVYCVILVLLAIPLGRYMGKVMNGEHVFLSGVLQPVERVIYRVLKIDPDEDMDWKKYSVCAAVFSVLSLFVLWAILCFQKFLPLNPEGIGGTSWHLGFNTAASFTTNTNWQAYSGESTLSYFSQMLGLNFQNFVSAAIGIAVLFALIRGFVRVKKTGIGNFYADMTKTVLYILIPLSMAVSLVIASQGVPQTFKQYDEVQLLEPVVVENEDGTTTEVTKAVVPLGPGASQIAIKQLGTNGGGFWGNNSAHPFENPTPLSNLFEMISLLLIPAGLCFTFGRNVKDKRQGIAIFLAMFIMLAVALVIVGYNEQAGTPQLAQDGSVYMGTEGQAGGNMEGKETRFGIATSATWATFTTAASNGSVNSMHDSYTPLGGLVPMLLMQLGEVVFGGTGCGLYGMIGFAIMTVFIAGLMVGRTPEYLCKKIEPFEMKMAVLVCLATPIAILVGSGIAALLPSTHDSLNNPGAHGLSEMLYAYSSAGGNNGSAFAGFNANTPFLNVSIGLVMLFVRFLPMFATLAIAGSLVGKKKVAVSSGTLPTHNAMFISLLIFVVLLVGALSFFPALSLGPVAEFFQMIA